MIQLKFEEDFFALRPLWCHLETNYLARAKGLVIMWSADTCSAANSFARCANNKTKNVRGQGEKSRAEIEVAFPCDLFTFLAPRVPCEIPLQKS